MTYSARGGSGSSLSVPSSSAYVVSAKSLISLSEWRNEHKMEYCVIVFHPVTSCSFHSLSFVMLQITSRLKAIKKCATKIDVHAYPMCSIYHISWRFFVHYLRVQKKKFINNHLTSRMATLHFGKTEKNYLFKRGFSLLTLFHVILP